jgi:alpha-D-xyloside xylohydrolase
MGAEMTGGPNEIWSFGEKVYSTLKDYIFVRELLRPYLHAQAAETSRTGIPIMRPLLVEFPEDPTSWVVDDQFMFGRDVLVAPVLQHAARERPVYLPAGAGWTNAWTGANMQSGTVVTVAAPLETIPLFFRDGARLPMPELKYLNADGGRTGDEPHF